jgi:AGZA family xanthine/uracil permease-like MFS transporter
MMAGYKGEIEYADNFDATTAYKRELFDGSNFLSSFVRAELGPATRTGNIIDDFFRITQRGSTIATEFIGGLTIFFTIAYVLTLNAILLEDTGMARHAVFFSSCLASGIFSYLMGITVNVPVVLGPSLALNILFAQISTTCSANPDGDVDGPHCPTWGESSLPWSDTLGAVFLSGWFYAFFTFCGLRGYIYAAVPKSLRASIAVGTGFFLTMVGLKIGHITRVTVHRWYMDEISTAGNCVADSTGSYTCGNHVDLNVKWYNHGITYFSDDPYARIAVLGIVFATALEMFKIRGSLIIAIYLATFIGINFYRCKSTWQSSLNDDSIHDCVTNLHIWEGNPYDIPFIVNVKDTVAGKLSFKFANKPYFWQVVFTFLFFELYDSFGALTGIITRMGDTRNHPTVATDRVNRAMVIDGFGVWLGSIMGCNSITVYIESNTGVEVGARTGLAAVVAGSCLLLCMLFVYPFVAIIPACATTSALVMVGVYTVQEYKNIETDNFVHLFSGFFTIAVMGLTYSITNGICFGFISYVALQFTIFIMAQIKPLVGSYWPAWLKEQDGVQAEMPHPVMIISAAFMAARFSLLLQQ